MTDDNPINWYIEILKHVKMLILKTEFQEILIGFM
jgi:hypothetical protein